jgi:hypothetical protein
LILPGAANITTAAGDAALVVQDNGDAVKVVAYLRANGLPLFLSTDGTMAANSDALVPSQKAVKTYTDAAIDLRAPFMYCQVAVPDADIDIATALQPGQVHDGVTLTNGAPVFVWNQQASPEQNGVWISFSTPFRSPAFPAWPNYVGALISVVQGDRYAGSIWQNTNAIGGTLGVSALTFALRASAAPIVIPGGRITNSSGAPVPTADVAGAGTIYYAPYLHQSAPLYDGGRFVPTDIGGELSQALSDTAKSPAAAQNYSCYDLFLWNDAGTIRCTRGPAWAKSATATMTIASPCVVSMTAHGGQDGDPVVFSTTGALPTGLVAGTEYYLLNASANAFNVSATPFGAAINTSGSQSGTHTAVVRSSVNRYTGAGTSEIERVKGVWLNKVAITNGPAAQRGTYVGTVRTNGSAQVDLKFGSLAALGGTASIGLWNLYNRVPVGGMVMDDTNSWTYNSTWRPFNGSSSNQNNRLEAVRGLNEDPVAATMNSMFTNPAGAAGHVGIGVDSTSVNSGTSFEGTVSTSGGVFSSWRGLPGLGFHKIYALEHIQGSGNVTFMGDNGFAGKPYQSGLCYETRY